MTGLPCSAANATCSSGGGGGTKGPAVIDKRNQELPCPHCERTFKQAGRLQEHIRKQHAGGGGDGEGAEGAVPPPQAAPPPAAPAAPAAAPRPAQEPATSASGAGAAAAQPRPVMMDVGSRAGYYSAKSPKLLLHELCQKEKVKPRYKATEAGNGMWKCKVGAARRLGRRNGTQERGRPRWAWGHQQAHRMPRGAAEGCGRWRSARLSGPAGLGFRPALRPLCRW